MADVRAVLPVGVALALVTSAMVRPAYCAVYFIRSLKDCILMEEIAGTYRCSAPAAPNLHNAQEDRLRGAPANA